MCANESQSVVFLKKWKSDDDFEIDAYQAPHPLMVKTIKQFIKDGSLVGSARDIPYEISLSGALFYTYLQERGPACASQQERMQLVGSFITHRWEQIPFSPIEMVDF